jgi:hypothetical protein
MESHNREHQLVRHLQRASTPTKTIHITGVQCRGCHAGTRDFNENLMAPRGSLMTNQLSSISSGRHNSVHNPSEVGRLKMWRSGQ